MKLVWLACMFTAVFGATQSKLDKCHKLPKGGSRRYTQPRTIERGNNQPAAINFLIDNRDDLLSVFNRGVKTSERLNELIQNNMYTLSVFTNAVDDIYMGQIFREARQKFVNLVNDGQNDVNKRDIDLGKIYRDNTQRATKALRDITFNPEILSKLEKNTEFMTPLIEFVQGETYEGVEVYKNFLEVHGRSFIPEIKDATADLKKTNLAVQNALYKVLADEKLKSSYRQLVNELPLVYQFFNDNIDFIMMSNMEKELDQAIASDILMELAKDQDPQIKSMIERNSKFIKKLMTQRAEQQMKEKAVQKVMAKNAELKQAADNEAEFNRLVAEARQQQKEITKELKEQIWQQVIAKTKAEADEELANQTKQKTNKDKPTTGLTRYEHLAGIVGLLPDDLKTTVADMVKQSCPDLDLNKIDDPNMKVICEQQPDNFLDQLLEELHNVCEMFGLIDESKIITKNIGGVEVQFYAADFLEGKKVEW